MSFSRIAAVFCIGLGIALPGCFRFSHMDKDLSTRPERAMGSGASIMMPGEGGPSMPGSTAGAGAGSSSQSGPSQSGSSSQSGSGAPPGDDGMVMIGGGSGSYDQSNSERQVPIIGPFTALLGYPFWALGKSNEEKADKAADERDLANPGNEAASPQRPRGEDDHQRQRLEAENERILEQLSQKQSSQRRASIGDELAALERTLGSRAQTAPESTQTAPDTPVRPTAVARVKPLETVEAVDRNRDGRPDLWAHRVGGVTQREELDDDHDGRADRILYYDERSRLSRSEEDHDSDGRMETVSQYAEGALARRRADSDGDGQTDSWSFFRDGEMVRHEVDRDADGFRDLVLVYDDGELTREEDDRNRDGRPDLISMYDGGAVTEKHEDIDYDGLPDVTSFYEKGRLVRRTVSSEGALESWSDGAGS